MSELKWNSKIILKQLSDHFDAIQYQILTQIDEEHDEMYLVVNK